MLISEYYGLFCFCFLLPVSFTSFTRNKHCVHETNLLMDLLLLVLLGSPVTRWASVAFGAGVGIGSAYTECSYKFDGSPAKLTPTKILDTPASPVRLFFFTLFM